MRKDITRTQSNHDTLITLYRWWGVIDDDAEPKYADITTDYGSKYINDRANRSNASSSVSTVCSQVSFISLCSQLI